MSDILACISAASTRNIRSPAKAFNLFMTATAAGIVEAFVSLSADPYSYRITA
jgi:hypothetical protein